MEAARVHSIWLGKMWMVQADKQCAALQTGGESEALKRIV